MTTEDKIQGTFPSQSQGGSDRDHIESLDQQKERILNLWGDWKEIQKIPELFGLVDRKAEYVSDLLPKELLSKYEYPERSKISELSFGKWNVEINPKFIKDGYVYLLRGDHPNLEDKGFYSLPFGYAKKTTKQLSEELQSSKEVGYFLYANEVFLKKAEPTYENVIDELALKQSQTGGSSFISTTTNLETAIAGTGNQPDKDEQESYEVYVIKIPMEYVINSNTGNFFGMEEDEYLIPDYVAPNEIVAKFKRDEKEEVFEYLNKELGISKEDLRIRET